MLRLIMFFACTLFGTVSTALDPSTAPRTLAQVLWDIGVVDKTQADIERSMGNDPITLIELPEVTNWVIGLTGSDMREVAMIIPMWFVKDTFSGVRFGANFSVWCDNGSLYQDTVQVQELKKAEGNATVEWAFDGEPFVESVWTQKDNFVLPPDDFPHDMFVRQLASAKFLVLKVRGQAGLDNRLSSRVRSANTAIIPVSLSGDDSSLSELIRGC